MRQKETTKLNAIMSKLGLARGNELNRKIYKEKLLLMGISPFDIVALDEELTSKGLLKEGVALSDYVSEKLTEEEKNSFLVLFGLD